MLLVITFNIIITIFIRILEKNYFSPASLFSIYWSIFILIPLILASEYKVHWFAILWITISALSFYFGIILGKGIAKNKIPNGGRKEIHLAIEKKQKTLTWLLLLTTTLSFLNPLILITLGDHGISEILSLEGLLSIANQNSVQRYAGELEVPLVAKFFVTFSYVSAFIAGIKISKGLEGKKELVLILLSAAPSLLITILLTTKASTLYFIVVALSSYISTKVLLGEKTTIRYHQIKYIVFTPLVIIGIVFITAHLRVGHMEMSNSQIFDHYRPTLFGYLSGFSEWLTYYIQLHNHENSYGKYTFAGPLQLLNITSREMGLYTENSSTNGNIYTIFRGFIEDFGLLGSLIFIVITGTASGFAYKKVCYGKIKYVPVLTLIYSTIFWSLFVSITIYTTIILSTIISFVIMKPLFGKKAIIT